MNTSRRALIAGAIAAPTLLVAPAAVATTFTNKYSGNDAMKTTTLKYSFGHGTFTLRVWVNAYGAFVSNKYSIKMYDRYDRQVWSASSQTARNYTIGKNVTKVVITRSAATGATTYFKKP